MRGDEQLPASIPGQDLHQGDGLSLLSNKPAKPFPVVQSGSFPERRSCAAVPAVSGDEAEQPSLRDGILPAQPALGKAAG